MSLDIPLTQCLATVFVFSHQALILISATRFVRWLLFVHSSQTIFALMHYCSYRTIYPAPSVFQICFLSRWDFVGWRIDRYLFSHFSQWCTSSFTEKGKQGSPILHIHIQIWSSGTQVMLLLSKTSISFQTKYCQKKLHLRIFSLRSLHHKKCAICNIVDSQLNCIDYH